MHAARSPKLETLFQVGELDEEQEPRAGRRREREKKKREGGEEEKDRRTDGGEKKKRGQPKSNFAEMSPSGWSA